LVSVFGLDDAVVLGFSDFAEIVELEPLRESVL
jgi:hypothetical protein